MRWLEQLQKDKEKWKELPDRRSRFLFLYDYYKIPIITAVLAVCLILYLVVHSLLVTPVKLHVVLVNSDALVMECDESVFEEIYKQTGYEEKGVIDVRTDLYLEDDDSIATGSREVLAALFTMGDVDVYVSDPAHFDPFAKQGAFLDLKLLEDEAVLSSEDLYILETEEGTIIPGIIVREGSFLQQAGYYHHDVILGIAAAGDHLEESIVFLKEILQK